MININKKNIAAFYLKPTIDDYPSGVRSVESHLLGQTKYGLEKELYKTKHGYLSAAVFVCIIKSV